MNGENNQRSTRNSRFAVVVVVFVAPAAEIRKTFGDRATVHSSGRRFDVVFVCACGREAGEKLALKKRRRRPFTVCTGRSYHTTVARSCTAGRVASPGSRR